MQNAGAVALPWLIIAIFRASIVSESSLRMRKTVNLIGNVCATFLLGILRKKIHIF